ncbi:MAG: adenylosuccinate lyase [Proteobacteria bacterium]|nr:adenylosuccinate lyase [Pseudomonadota bacterium]
MPLDPIDALSPLDGRYAAQLGDLRNIFSEAGLMRARVRVECAWMLALIQARAGEALDTLPAAACNWLAALAADPAATDVAAIKAIEARTNHDVKAVEYWLRAQLKECGATPAQLEWMHFGCTSEDINNLAYALMMSEARSKVLLPALEALLAALLARASADAEVPMLSRTHGQTATPTTVGKEFANFATRLQGQLRSFAQVQILGKMNGAVGNFNAHLVALPALPWLNISDNFVASLGLVPNRHTTQIEPHDWIAEYCHALARIDTILIDFARDMWGYISLGYFKQRAVAGEVGSSTMPHKVNPIDFENAEGNFGLANALLAHLAQKLPVSRWQRDLSDSTVLRNLGVALGHCQLALKSLLKGLGKVELAPEALRADLERAWEVLAEAVQTVMRTQGIADGYDRLKDFSRGQPVSRDALHAFIRTLELPEAERQRLLELTPERYLGLAARLARGET